MTNIYNINDQHFVQIFESTIKKLSPQEILNYTNPIRDKRFSTKGFFRNIKYLRKKRKNIYIMQFFSDLYNFYGA